MVGECIILRMEILILDFGRTINLVEKEFTYFQMAIFTKENLSKEESMEEVFINIRLEQCTMVNGQKIKNQDLACITI